MRKMKAQDRVIDTKARGGSFTPVPETPVVSVRADVRPRVKNGGGKVTTTKAGKYGPSEILTPFRRSARERT